MAESLFNKIINGEIPCHKVYEDDQVFAFLDINPLSDGHTLVIPKEPAPTIDKISDDAAAALGRALPRIARAIIAATGTKDFNILQNNGAPAHQAVPHVHFHIIPKAVDGSGLRIGWKPKEFNSEGASELAQNIVDELAKAG